MKCEMLTVRAFLNFDMLRLLWSFYSENQHAASIPYNDVYKVQVLPMPSVDSLLKYKVLRDLNEAERLLKDADPVISGGRLANRN